MAENLMQTKTHKIHIETCKKGGKNSEETPAEKSSKREALLIPAKEITDSLPSPSKIIRKLSQRNVPDPSSVKKINLKVAEQEEEVFEGYRKVAAILINTKAFERLIVVLIIVYTLLVFVSLILEDELEESEEGNFSLLIVEIFILAIFSFEIIITTYALRKKYYSDLWNVFDAIVIVVSIVFVILELSLDISTLNSILKIRAMFRLVRIFILMRKVNVLRKKGKKMDTGLGYDMRSPVEKVLEILNSLRHRIPESEKDLLIDIHWSINMISSNKLYEPAVGMNKDKNSIAHKDVISWVETFSKEQRNSEKKQPVAAESIESPYRVGHDDEKKLSFQIDESPEVTAMLKTIKEVDFDIFEFEEKCSGHALVSITGYLLNKKSLFTTFMIDKFKFNIFANKIQNGYKNNPYHNKTHAADVVQTVNYYMTTCEMKDICQLKHQDVLSLLVGAMVHDYEHDGKNNVWHVNIRSEFATLYNDQSVLENHHVAATYQLLQDDKYNIFENLEKDDFNNIRKIMISIVLDTDMTKHFTKVGMLKSRIQADNFDPADSDKLPLLCMALHLADISNQGKKYSICKTWTLNLFKEFYNQGDLERKKGFPISPLMDKTAINIAKSQLGFIDVIIQPSFETWEMFLPNIGRNIEFIQENKNIWKGKMDEYEGVMNDHTNELKAETENAKNHSISGLDKIIERDEASERKDSQPQAPTRINNLNIQLEPNSPKKQRNSVIVERRTSKTNNLASDPLIKSQENPISHGP